MQDIEVKTGFGYLKNAQGNVTDKCVLSPGLHKLSPEYTFVEVADEAELATVQVYQAPAPPDTPEKAKRKKIDAELEAMAIERLQAKGQWP